MTDRKLWVWRDVFTDYTSGIAFAIAPSREEAIDAIVNESFGDNADALEARFPGYRDRSRALIVEHLSGLPEMYELDADYGTHIYGGS